MRNSKRCRRPRGNVSGRSRKKHPDTEQRRFCSVMMIPETWLYVLRAGPGTTGPEKVRRSPDPSPIIDPSRFVSDHHIVPKEPGIFLVIECVMYQKISGRDTSPRVSAKKGSSPDSPFNILHISQRQRKEMIPRHRKDMGVPGGKTKKRIVLDTLHKSSPATGSITVKSIPSCGCPEAGSG
jgi:hypothetical protein